MAEVFYELTDLMSKGIHFDEDFMPAEPIKEGLIFLQLVFLTSIELQ